MVPGQRQTLPFLFPKPKLAKGAQVRPPSHLAALASLPHCGSIDELPGLPHSLAKALNPALQPLHFAPAKTPTDQDLTSLGTFFKKFSCSSQPHANTCFFSPFPAKNSLSSCCQMPWPTSPLSPAASGRWPSTSTCKAYLYQGQLACLLQSRLKTCSP